MSSKTDLRLTPRQRLARGLTYTAMGPVDVTRGAVGLGVHGAQEVLAHLPAVIADVRKPKRDRRRPLVLAAVGVLILGGGAVAFSIVRRSTKPEPSALPPSVDVAPRP